MGLGTQHVYVTRLTDDDPDLFLTYWPLERREGKEGFFDPTNSPILLDMVAPNHIPELTSADGSVEVDVVPCEEETGLYLTCEDNYFGGEKWLYNSPVHLVTDKYGHKHYKQEETEYSWPIHLQMDFDMKSYDPVKNVRLVRKL